MTPGALQRRAFFHIRASASQLRDDDAPRIAIKLGFEAMADDPKKIHRLQSVELDEESLAAASRDQEQERQIAIFDLLEENYFRPEGAERGPYELRMGLVEN